MAEIPAPAKSIQIDWCTPDEEPDWWDADEDGPWTSTGSWSITVEGIGEILTDTTYSNDGGFKTIGEAVTAAEKWATDRRMEIRTFGVSLRASSQSLQGDG